MSHAQAEQLVDGGAGVVGWLFQHSVALAWGVLALAVLVVALRIAYTVAVAWADLRLRWRGGSALGAATDWLTERDAAGHSGLYRGYLQSEAWQARRRRTLMLAGHACQRCGARATDAHHTTYARLGRERDGDLLALCAGCHADAHGR